MKASNIFAFDGHGEPSYIICGQEETEQEETEQERTQLTRNYILSQPANSLDCRLVVYKACLAGSGGRGAANLAQATVDRGATTVVAFKDVIGINHANAWVTEFCQLLLAKKSVYDAAIGALTKVEDEYGEYGGTETVVVFGSTTQQLVY